MKKNSKRDYKVEGFLISEKDGVQFQIPFDPFDLKTLEYCLEDIEDIHSEKYKPDAIRQSKHTQLHTDK